MGAGINAAGEAAGDDEAAVRQIPGQALSHLIPVGRRAARANDRDDMAAQKLHVSPDIQQGRRIVDLLEALRVLRLVPSEQSAACGLDLSQFLGGIADGAARVEGLGDGGGQALALEGRERGGEDRLRAAEFAQELASHARAKAGCQRERQPAYIIVSVHREGNPRRAYAGGARASSR